MRGTGTWRNDCLRPLPVGADSILPALQAVAEIGAEASVFDDHGLLRGNTLVVEGRRTPLSGDGAVVVGGDDRGGHDLAELAGVDAGAP